MRILRYRRSAPSTTAEPSATASHPESCPWCGQQRVRGIVSTTDDQQYRCAACGTTFFIHTPVARPLAQRRPRTQAEPVSSGLWCDPNSM